MSLLLGAIGLAIIVAVVTKLYFYLTWGRCTSTKRMDGKTVLITGANSGIGYQTALDLAKRGARVIITSENEKDCIRARGDIIKETGNENIVAKYLDLTSFAVVRSFAKDILDNEERLDVLINNAGTVGLGNNYSKDGILLGLQVNYYGMFLLTNLLVDLLRKSKPARIINVASILSQFNYLDMNDPELKDLNRCPVKIFSDVLVYSNSKLFVVYFTWELAARLRKEGVTVNCVHPGCVNTAIFTRQVSWYTPIYYMFRKHFFKTAEQGAQTSIHCAVANLEGISGQYFEDCAPIKPYITKDLVTMKKIWNKSVELVKLTPEELKV